jgi:hypothetical protein
MATLTIFLPDESYQRLESLASGLGQEPAELASMMLSKWLDERSPNFEIVAKYVFEKNAELYRRLA